MYVAVYVYPSCRKEVVRKVDEHTYQIQVRQPAQGNRANDRVRIILADEYVMTHSDVRLVAGHRSRKKIFVINM